MKLFERILGSQYRRPSGILGPWIGSRMDADHRPENLWTVFLLQAEPEDQILEISFGPGVAIQELSKIVTQGWIAGIDYSRSMVRVARRRNARAIRRGRVELHQADAAVLPFSGGTFDKAYSIHSIYFWQQPQSVLQEVRRVLKAGGFFVVTFLPKERMKLNDPDTQAGTPGFMPYSGEELARLLLEAGFDSARIRADSNPGFRSNYSVIGVKESV